MLIRHSLAKPKYKEKLRLRSYGVPKYMDDTVFLELKRKVNGVSYKRRAPMTLYETEQYLKYGAPPKQMGQIVDEIGWTQERYRLEPKVMLFYDRIALYGIDDSNLRVTFDRNIRWRDDRLRFHNGDYGKDVYVRITGGELEAISGGDTIDANGNIFVEGGTLRLSAPAEPVWEGALLCNGEVTFTGGNIAVSGRVGVGVISKSQPVLLISHTESQAEGSTLSLRDQSGRTLLEHTARQVYSNSAFSSSEMQVGNTYGIYVDGVKKTDITLRETVTKISDDGGEYTGEYPRNR